MWLILINNGGTVKTPHINFRGSNNNNNNKLIDLSSSCIAQRHPDPGNNSSPPFKLRRNEVTFSLISASTTIVAKFILYIIRMITQSSHPAKRRHELMIQQTNILFFHVNFVNRLLKNQILSALLVYI